MRVIEARGLPGDPLDAAAAFHATVVSEVRAAGDAAVTIAFDHADHTHTGWRLAAVQGLAREAARRRVNAIAGEDAAAIDAALAYLEAAPGVTGQYLPLDGQGAGSVAG